MKKLVIAAVLGFSLVGNAFAECDSLVYNTPEELRPSCTENSPAATPEPAPLRQAAKADTTVESGKPIHAPSGGKSSGRKLGTSTKTKLVY